MSKKDVNIKIRMGLTALIKKSPCKADTTPKLVYLNTASIIQLSLGRRAGREAKAAMSKGTSEVDW